MDTTTAAPGRLRAERLFEALDAGDVPAFVAAFAPDAVHRIGDRPELRGREAIERGNAAFLGSIAGLHHTIDALWTVGDTTLVRLSVRYDLLDGGVEEMRTFTVFRDGPDGIEELDVFFGVAPAFGGAHA